MLDDVQYLRCGDVTLCVGLAGEGAPLLFLGGTGWDLRAARTPLRSVLTSAYQVALFDQRGQGRSEKPEGPYSMRGYAEDAVAVADALGWDRFHLVGYSFGGMVAQEVAIGFPDRVDRLVLAATTSGGAGGSSYPVHDLLHLPPQVRARRGLEVSDMRFRALQRDDPEAAAAQVAARAKAQIRFMDEPGARMGLSEQLAARAQHDCYDRLPAITSETLVLAGLDDSQAPLHAQHQMAARIPDVTLRTLPGAHNFLFESDVAYEVMAAFLGRGQMPAS